MTISIEICASHKVLNIDIHKKKQLFLIIYLRVDESDVKGTKYL